VHALRLRNELPLQGQFPEPKMFYGGLGRGVGCYAKNFIQIPYLLVKNNLLINHHPCFANPLSLTLSRKGRGN
jgi:hypothetical protein